MEAVGHFSRALAQIATLPATPALRREEIKLQVALIAPVIHVHGFAAPETKAAVERANSTGEAARRIDPFDFDHYGIARRCAQLCNAS